MTWPAVPLGDVAEIQAGVTLGRQVQGETVRLPYLRVANVLDGRLDLTTVKSVAIYKHERDKWLLRADDLLLTEGGDWDKLGRGALWHGELPECVHQNHVFRVRANAEQVLPGYLSALVASPHGKHYFRNAAKRTTGVASINQRQLKAFPVPLPPLAEQRRIVGRVDAIAGRLAEVRRLRAEVEADIDRMLFGAYTLIAADAPRRPLREVAPLVRRPAPVDPAKQYPGVSVRSFGRGTFHNPPQAGSDITWEKPHQVRDGDILVSNIKAWEGAIAVAGQADHERYGSHRYLTFVPVAGLATARFVCFHLLTPDGLFHVGEASPGSADRNRTLSAKAMLDIPVPVPTYDEQLWFDSVYERADALRSLQAATAAELDAVLPAVLAEAFAGRL